MEMYVYVSMGDVDVQALSLLMLILCGGIYIFIKKRFVAEQVQQVHTYYLHIMYNNTGQPDLFHFVLIQHM